MHQESMPAYALYAPTLLPWLYGLDLLHAMESLVKHN